MRLRSGITLLVAACLVAGCGEGGDGPREPAAKAPQAVGKRIAGSVVQYADCADWVRGSKREREATVLELRDQLTQQGESSNESPLPDDRAYRILQKTCSNDFSASLRLYKLYARVQGFAPLAE